MRSSSITVRCIVKAEVLTQPSSKMFAGLMAAPVVLGIYGKSKYDEYRRKPMREQFAVSNANAAALYFPQTVIYDGSIQILDINAVDPNFIEPQETQNDNETKKQFKAFGRRSMKWFNKTKGDVIKKMDEAKKEFDKKQQDEKENDDESKNEHKSTENFSENIHLQPQLDIPSYFEAYSIESEQDIASLIEVHQNVPYKWKECRVYIQEHCVYIFVDSEWKYFTFFNESLQFIPLTMSTKDNLSYFHWIDSKKHHLIGRCADNFLNKYLSIKTEIISNSIRQSEHNRRLWIMNENMLKARRNTLCSDGNMSAIYHRNEFELDLKLLLTQKKDLRSNYWGKFEETEICEMANCNNKFNQITMRRHHCYMCGRVICDECGKNTFENPVYLGMEQRACNDLRKNIGEK